MTELDTFAYCQNAECKKLTNTKELFWINFSIGKYDTPTHDVFMKFYCKHCSNRFMLAMGYPDSKLLQKSKVQEHLADLVDLQTEEEQKAKDAPRKKVVPYYVAKGNLNYSCQQILSTIYKLEQQNIEPRSGDIWKTVGHSRGLLHTYLQLLSDEKYIAKIYSSQGNNRYSYNLLDKGKAYLKSQQTKKPEFHVIDDKPSKIEIPDRSYGARS